MITKKSLLSLLMVVIILLVLATTVGPTTGIHSLYKANQQRSCTDISLLISALELFKVENFSYPTMNEGLNVLVDNPGDKYPNWRLYIKGRPIDPWNNPYYYVIIKDDFEIYSLGADGKSGGIRWNKDIFYPECDEPKYWYHKIFK